MNILMLNTFDATGGAARSAVRLLEGVRNLGVEAHLLVQFQTGTVEGVICSRNPLNKLLRRLKVFLGLLPVRFYPNRPDNNFSPALLPDRVTLEIAPVNPDILHLHWLCAGFLKVETLAGFNKPLIWTLHDSWAFTGGCHVPFACKRYQQACGFCPVLGSSRENDLSRRIWERKRKSWRNLDLTVVTPSSWLAGCARSSSLFRDVRVEVIPNGIDTRVFQPENKANARKLLGLPQDKKIILFGAVWPDSDPNKGYHLLTRALPLVEKKNPDCLTVVFGAENFPVIRDLKMKMINLGKIDNDHDLVTAYSAADVFVSPSMLENLPNTIMEAMACGTPCVAFNQGGVPDLIEHRSQGYLAQAYDIEDLADGISWLLEDNDRHHELSTQAVRKIKAEFKIEQAANQYKSLYQEILGDRRN